MNNDCDGCAVERLNCVYASLEGCPCINCLIKMICKRECPDLRTHVNKVYKPPIELKGN